MPHHRSPASSTDAMRRRETVAPRLAVCNCLAPALQHAHDPRRLRGLRVRRDRLAYALIRSSAVTRRTFSVACPFLAAAGRTPGSSPFIAANSTASVTLAFRAAAGRTPGSSPFIAAKTILFILFMSFTSIHQHTATAAHQPAAPTLCVGARQPRHQTAALVLYAAAYSRVQPRAGWISTTV